MSLKPSKKLQKLSKQKLYNLADLAQVKTWNYELPTITKGAGFTSRQHWQENKTFWVNFSSNIMFKHTDHGSMPGQFAPDLYFLQGLQKEFSAGGAFSDFAIFGGSLVDILMEEEPNDLDIAVFVKGKNNKEKGEIFAKKVQLFVEKCISWMETQNAKILRKIDQGHSNYNSRMLYEINDNDKLKINRYRNVFTVQLPCCQSKIQFIPKDGIDDLLNDTHSGKTLLKVRFLLRREC